MLLQATTDIALIPLANDTGEGRGIGGGFAQWYSAYIVIILV